MDRRKFLHNSGLALGAVVSLPPLSSCASPSADDTFTESFGNWADIRKQFNLTQDRIHMSQMLLASHPLPVRRAIEKYRKLLDENPTEYWEESFYVKNKEKLICEAAARYLKTDAEEIALTDSTTMGLGILYSGLKLKPGDEILSTTHDHYSTDMSLDFAALRGGAIVKRISLYDEPAKATVDEIVNKLTSSVTDSTRVIAVTWVHSGTGVKLPIGEMTGAVKEINSKRREDKRIYVCVDGVHGFGVEDVTMEDLGCDFFVAGTHKWIFGPRGTGILWGRKDAWDMFVPVIPSFGLVSYSRWLGMMQDEPLTFRDYCSPGGFHSFENRWALVDAFEWQLKIGKRRVQERTHQLSALLKEGLQNIGHINLHTPVDPELSAGINCFEVDGITPEEFVKRMGKEGIIGNSSPYKTSYCRLTPSLVNSEEEVERCIEVLEKIRE